MLFLIMALSILFTFTSTAAPSHPGMWPVFSSVNASISLQCQDGVASCWKLDSVTVDYISYERSDEIYVSPDLAFTVGVFRKSEDGSLWAISVTHMGTCGSMPMGTTNGECMESALPNALSALPNTFYRAMDTSIYQLTGVCNVITKVNYLSIQPIDPTWITGDPGCMYNVAPPPVECLVDMPELIIDHLLVNVTDSYEASEISSTLSGHCTGNTTLTLSTDNDRIELGAGVHSKLLYPDSVTTDGSGKFDIDIKSLLTIAPNTEAGSYEGWHIMYIGYP
ncbi:TPA: hypothetical protein ACKFAD_002631 [Citrobacter koseri]